MFKSNKYFWGDEAAGSIDITIYTKYYKANEIKAYILFIPDSLFDSDNLNSVLIASDSFGDPFILKNSKQSEPIKTKEINIPENYFEHFTEIDEGAGLPPRTLWIYAINKNRTEYPMIEDLNSVKIKLMPFKDICAIKGIPYNKFVKM